MKRIVCLISAFFMLLILTACQTDLAGSPTGGIEINPDELAFASREEIRDYFKLAPENVRTYDKNGRCWAEFTIRDYNSSRGTVKRGIDFGFQDHTYIISADALFNEQNQCLYMKFYHSAGGPDKNMANKMEKEVARLYGSLTELYGKPEEGFETVWRKEGVSTIKVAATHDKEGDDYGHFYSGFTELNFWIDRMTEMAADDGGSLSDFIPSFDDPSLPVPRFGYRWPHVRSSAVDGDDFYIGEWDGGKTYMAKPYGFVLDVPVYGETGGGYSAKDFKYYDQGVAATAHIREISGNNMTEYSFFYGGIHVFIRNGEEFMINQLDWQIDDYVLLQDWSPIPSEYDPANPLKITIFVSDDLTMVGLNGQDALSFPRTRAQDKNSRVKYWAQDGTTISVDKLTLTRYRPELYLAHEEELREMFLTKLMKENKDARDWNYLYSQLARTHLLTEQRDDLSGILTEYLNRGNPSVSPVEFYVHEGFWEELIYLLEQTEIVTPEEVERSVCEMLADNLHSRGELILLINSLYDAYRFYPEFGYLFDNERVFLWPESVTTEDRQAVIENISEMRSYPWKEEQEGFLKVLF